MPATRPTRRSRAARLFAVTLSAATLSLSAASAAAPASAAPQVPAAGPTPAGEAVSLPQLRTALAADATCAVGSQETAAEQPWSRQALGLDRVWRLSQGEDVTVAVVDTGVSTTVPALDGRVTAVGDAGEDCVGHGTFAAGLIAAARLDGVGVAGVAPHVRILAVRGTDERGTATADRVAQGIRAAADRKADVIYVGLALTTGREELTDAVSYAAARDALVVAPAAPDAVPKDPATGDPGPRPRPYFPGFLPDVLSVMDHGTGGARPEDAVPVFSADLAAPGGAVVSIGPRGSGHYIGSGSSLAAAHVAGAAALVRAYQPELDAAEVSRRLVAFAYPADVPMLDPYAAVAAVAADRAGQRPAQAPAHVPGPPPAATQARALMVAAAGGAVVLLVAAGAVIVPRGKARSWQPAGMDGAGGAGSAGGAGGAGGADGADGADGVGSADGVYGADGVGSAEGAGGADGD
ncbi:S8 family serine peptidase [Streptomyces sp. NPDC002870]|uniref:S8 family serine peptidase n=1 Tax=Streptomyces sp. NPDC002870 TaxID=3364666 RepID=UPI0036BF2889